MKITDVTRTTSSNRLRRTEEKSAKTESAAAKTAEPELIAGVPESELSPRVRELLTSLMEEVKKLRRQLHNSQQRVSELEMIADTDPLVGILNRRAFTRELSRTLAMMDRYGAPACLVFADLNDLKIINDEKGHAAGDAALAHVANVLAANVRQTDYVGRIGGDEFGIILTQTDQKTGEEKAASLTALVEEGAVAWRGEPFPAKISCGVVEIREGASVEAVYEDADSAMYRTKRNRQ